jgi:adenylosuccinate synthase
MPWHPLLDQAMDKKNEPRTVRSARAGTGPCYADKVLRLGIRVADILDDLHFAQILKNTIKRANNLLKLYELPELNYDDVLSVYKKYADRIRPYVKNDAEIELNKLLSQGKRVIFEGAHGTFLDSSLGTYPFVSASSTLAAGICSGAGVGPSKIAHTLVVVKAHTTRTKRGPLPTKIHDQPIVEKLKKSNMLTTKKLPDERRYGWLDLVMTREALMLNGADSIAISKLDELDDLPEIKICIGYKNKKNGKEYDYLPPITHEIEDIEPQYIVLKGWMRSTRNARTLSDLPEEARIFVKRIEAVCGVDVSYISVGANREQTIKVNDLLPF